VLPVLVTAAAAEDMAVASALQAVPVPNIGLKATLSAPTVSRTPTGEVTQPLPSLLELLRTPDSLATAVILQEVLGPPRCRRSGVR
jgi:hypothetical protein